MGELSPAALGPPEKLSSHHDLAGFDSGEPALDDWLRRHAARNEASGASRTYVVCVERKVAAHYSLAVGAATHEQVPGRIRRNKPHPIPVMVLGRLAVDNAFQGKGLGSALLRDAVRRTVQAADIAGIRALLVHAISEGARRFYESRGFIASPMDPMTVMLTIAEAGRILCQQRSGPRQNSIKSLRE